MKKLSDLPKISRPALRALHGAGYEKLDDLKEVSDEKLFKLHGMGPKALETLRTEARKRNLKK